MKIKKNNGITLIALIITVIVMLILVAVTISILVKSNIIGIAESAADKMKTAYEKESSLGSKITIGGVEYDGINDYLQKKCNHKYGEWTVVKEATYQEAGERYRTCTKCGIKQTEYPSMLVCEKHAYSESDWVIDQAATCIAKGTKHVICTNCRTRVDEEIEIDKANGHNYNIGVCTICGDVKLAVGQYVNYKPAGTAYSTKYPVEQKYSGYTADQDVYLQETKWRILNINADGSIDLISEKPVYIGSTSGNNTALYFKGSTGYNNGVEILNDLCYELYGTGKYATGGRSLDVEDIQEKMDTSVWSWEEYTQSSSGTAWGGTKEYTSFAYRYYPARWIEETKGNVDGASTEGTLEQSDEGELIAWDESTNGELKGKTYYQASSKITGKRSTKGRIETSGNILYNRVEPEVIEFM